MLHPEKNPNNKLYMYSTKKSMHVYIQSNNYLTENCMFFYF